MLEREDNTDGEASVEELGQHQEAGLVLFGLSSGTQLVQKMWDVTRAVEEVEFDGWMLDRLVGQKG